MSISSPVIARGRFLAALGFLVLSSATGCGKKDAVLARVGSKTVTASEFHHELDGVPFTSGEYLQTLPGRKELLELLVRRKVVLSEAERSPVAATPDVKEKLARMEAEIERQKGEARERLIVGEFIRSLREGELKVSDEDVRKFWSGEREVKAAHILVSDEAVAKNVLEKLKKGEPFGPLARKFSEDAVTGRQDGDLGYLLRGTLVPEFENALFALKAGETSGIVTSPYGFHVIRVTDERKLSETPFDKVSGRIRAILEKQRFQSWIDQTRKRYKISTDITALKGLPLREAVNPPSSGSQNPKN